jgi:hypothetical protein
MPPLFVDFWEFVHLRRRLKAFAMFRWSPQPGVGYAERTFPPERGGLMPAQDEFCLHVDLGV